MNNHINTRLTGEGVSSDLQRQPHLMLKLAENALQVAESLRDNYLRTQQLSSDISVGTSIA
jgi:hypothetical protein